MKRIVAFTGAGVSKESGIPTFQEMGDIRNKLTRGYFNENPVEFYKLMLKMKQTIDKAYPNKAHKSIARHKIPVVTMNIDGLHKKAGSQQVIEVHGNLDFLLCKRCRKKYDFSYLNNSIYCEDCNSLLNPNVVLYGDMIYRYIDAIDLIGSADELLVVGTSFYTSTSSDFVGRAERAGIKVKLINKDAQKQVPEYLEKIFG
ncbi:MAG: transcriptional regulator [Clostridia bacterium]|nr:transcriptional regulator [Clostridia bacterium]